MKNILLFAALLLGGSAAQAGTFSMVQINPNAGYCDNVWSDSSKYYYGAGDLKHFAQLNGLLYFVATDQPYNDELWVTDGTQSGTHKIKDINPNGGSGIGDLRVVGHKIYFLANETKTDAAPTDDYDLYVSDGTSAGTTKVKDLDQPFNNLLSEDNAGVTNGKVVFCTQTDVMVTDGSSTGTRSLAPITLTGYTSANGYCEMNGNVYFIVNSDIWKSDGTVAGTKAVKSIADSASCHWNLAFANKIKAFNGRLYIIGSPSGLGPDLYSFDGTATGPVTKVLSMPNGNCFPDYLRECGGSLWFAAYDTSTYALFKVNGTGADRICTITSTLTYSGNKILFPNDLNNGYHIVDAVTGAQSEFGRTDLPLSGIGFSAYPNNALVMGNKIIYQAYDSASTRQVMCITDGTSAGVQVVMPDDASTNHPFDYIFGCGIADLFDFTTYGNKVVIPADFNNAGRELWFYEADDLINGILEQAQSAAAIYPNPANDQLTIDLGKSQALSTEVSVQLIDMSGRIVSTAAIADQKAQVSVSSLATGSYVVNVTKGNNLIARQKIAVAH